MTGKILRTRLQLAAMVSIIIFSGCGGSDPEPKQTQADQVTAILTAGNGTWAPSTSGGILIDGVDMTDDLFPGFSITFQKGTFTTTGTSPVWLRHDSWTFKDETAKVIIRRQDNREITIEELSAHTLKLTLDWPATTSGGRQHSLKGKHEFILNK